MIRNLWRRHRIVFFLFAPIALVFVPLWLPKWVASQKRVELVSAKTHWFRDAKTKQPMCRVEIELEASKWARFRPSWWKSGALVYGDPIFNAGTSSRYPYFDFTLAIRDENKWRNLSRGVSDGGRSLVWNEEHCVFSTLLKNPILPDQQNAYAIIRIGYQTEEHFWKSLVHKSGQTIVWQAPPRSPFRFVLHKIETFSDQERRITFDIVPLDSKNAFPNQIGFQTRNAKILSERGRQFINAPNKTIIEHSVWQPAKTPEKLQLYFRSFLSLIPVSQGQLTLKADVIGGAYPAQEISAVIRE